MLKPLLLAASLAAICALPTLASGEFKPTPQMSFVVNLDSDERADSVFRMADLGALTALRATVQVTRLGNDARADPRFKIALENEAGESISLRLGTDTHAAPVLMQASLYEGDTDITSAAFLKTLALQEKIEIEFLWTATGEVTVRAGTEKVTLQAKSPLTSLKITASTGAIQVDPLQLGQLTP